MLKMKRLLSFALALVMLAAVVLPATAPTADAAGKFELWYSHISSNTYGLNKEGLTWTDKGTVAMFITPDDNPPSSVKMAVVTAGTDSAGIAAAQKFEMEFLNTEPVRFSSTRVHLYGFKLPSDFDSGIFVLWFFVDEYDPAADYCYYVMNGGELIDVIPKYTPDGNKLHVPPHSLYISRTSFTIYCFTASETSLKMEKQGVTPSMDGAEVLNGGGAGEYIYNIPVGKHTGIYTVWYTMDGGGSWNGLTDLVMLAGEIKSGPHNPDSVRDNTRMVSATGDIDNDGRITARVEVLNEVFTKAAVVTLSGDATQTSMTAFTEDGISPGVDGYERYGITSYTFDFGKLALDDGMYVMTAVLGTYSVECMQIEVHNGTLYKLLPGELMVSPSEIDDNGKWDNARFRIYLGEETMRLPQSGVECYSTDGGNKWISIDSLPEAITKWIDKGFKLWLSDKPMDTRTKKPPEGANYVKFPEVGKRETAPKLEVNYQLAHMEDGVLKFEPDDENLWVAVEKGKTAILSAGYVYRLEGTKEDRWGDEKPNGKVDISRGMFQLGAEGLPIPYSDEKENENTGFISHKAVKESFFVSFAPYLKEGVYYAASKPAKLTVSSYTKPPALKTNYKNETLKLVADIVLETERTIYEGIVSKEDAKKPVSITEMLDNDEMEIYYRKVPSAKKPASGFVEMYLAMRAEDSEWDSTLTDGKFRAAKDIEFRQKGVANAKWGGFKAPKNGTEQYEFRYKSSAKAGKMMYEGDDNWFIEDGIVYKRDDEEEVYAAGWAQDFTYTWGTFFDKNNKEKTGITSTCLT